MQVLGHEGMKRHSLCTDHAKLARLIRSTAVTGFSARPESRVVPGPAHLEQAQGHGAGIGFESLTRRGCDWNLVQARASIGRDLADTSPQAKGGELCRNLFYPGAPAWHRHAYSMLCAIGRPAPVYLRAGRNVATIVRACRPWKKIKQPWRR